MFWLRKKQQQFLSEFTVDFRYYSQVIIISYLPPSHCFEIRSEINDRGVVEDPIVLLEIVMPNNCKYYRWQRSSIITEIKYASINQEWEPIFRRVYTDMLREIDKKLLNWRI